MQACPIYATDYNIANCRLASADRELPVADFGMLIGALPADN